ncbi:MAG TPA: GxxExxY protein [Bacteroidales bacterium]|nr:GxxExxY protein [Bacteroidales bacterium]
MTENEISYLIRGAAFKVFTNLGPGLLESVYTGALAYELRKLGLKVAKEVSIPIIYEDIRFDFGFRLDLLVEDLVIIEVKSVEGLIPVYFKQILSYLKITEKKLGIPINFNCEFLNSKSLIRIVNGL